jgi:hypothetical protein
MNTAELALQGAVVDAVIAAGYRIYDRINEYPKFPYCSIGPSDITQDDAECIDGSEVNLQLDIWSRDPGFREAKQIGGALRQALHRLEATRDGLTFQIEHRITRYFRDPDGLTSHGAMSLVALIDVSA